MKERPENKNLGNNWIAYARRASKSGNAAELVARVAAYQLCKNPRDWVKFSQKDWLKELAMTLPEYKLALSKATKSGLIVQKKMKFYNRIVTGLKLSISAKIDMDRLPKEPILDESPKEPIYILEEGNTSYSYKKKIVSASPVTGLNAHLSGSLEKVTGKDGTMEPGKTVKEIMSEGFKVPKKHAPKTQGQAVIDLWRSCFESNYPGVFVGVFEIKHQAMIKQIIKAVPEGKALAVFAYVLNNWPDFIETVKEQKPFMKEVPSRPELGFIRFNVDLAVNGWLSASKSVSVPSSSVAKEAKPAGALVIKKSYKKDKSEIAGLDEILSKP